MSALKGTKTRVIDYTSLTVLIGSNKLMVDVFVSFSIFPETYSHIRVSILESLG